MTSRTIYKTSDVVNTLAENEILLPISRTDGKKGKSGLCIKVNALSDAVLQVVSIDPIGKQFLINAIDDVRSQIASALNKSGKAIEDDKIGVTGILAAMKLQVESQRFTKESVKAWFDEYMLSPLSMAVAAKYQGIDDSKLNKIIGTYLESFQVLAGRSPSMPNAIKAGLIRALEFLPEDHDTVTGNEIATRLEVVPEASAMLEML